MEHQQERDLCCFKWLRVGSYLLLQHDLVCPDLYILKSVIRNAICQNNSNSKPDHPSSQTSPLCLLFHKILTDPRAKTLVLISWNKADDVKWEIMFYHFAKHNNGITMLCLKLVTSTVEETREYILSPCRVPLYFLHIT